MCSAHPKNDSVKTLYRRRTELSLICVAVLTAHSFLSGACGKRGFSAFFRQTGVRPQPTPLPLLLCRVYCTIYALKSQHIFFVLHHNYCAFRTTKYQKIRAHQPLSMRASILKRSDAGKTGDTGRFMSGTAATPRESSPSSADDSICRRQAVRHRGARSVYTI